jgi:TonB family protein
MPAPRLALERPGTREEFCSSLVALVRGPASPEEFTGDPFFRNCLLDSKFPRQAFVAAIILQALLVAYPPPIWNIQPARPLSAAPRTEITWYGPVKDLPAILPSVHAPRAASRKEAPKTAPHPGADAFHPRQTILSEPLHPTHPRQTLIQPKAPLEPPKILPALPNIVQLANAQPERPKLQLSAKELSVLHPKTRAALAPSSVAAPEISLSEKQVGAIDIASSPDAPRRPALPVNPMSAPRSSMRKTESNAAAPDIAGRDGAGETLIALSATPAPVAPPPAIPAGNLSARISISPDGPQPDTPGGGAANAAGAGSRGPEGIFINGGNAANTSPTSGLGIAPTVRGAGLALPSRGRIAPDAAKSLTADAEGAAEAAPKLGLSPEKVLGAKRVYTLHVNMPNLTSASGSWILNFAELDEEAQGGHLTPASTDLAGPVPVRKVDPKYPPELRTMHVGGEVVLYAIIRKNGTVDSIQLVHSIDPNLDANAMEALAQWKFVPAEKHGEPVDLEAVVHIPFRSRGSTF